MALSIFVWINLINTRKVCDVVFAVDEMSVKRVCSNVFSLFRDEQVCCQKNITFGRNTEIMFESDEDISIESDFTRF